MTKTILIVEDDPFIAMDLQDTFERAGFNVIGPVAEVDPGLAALKQQTPDIAMLDYNLGSETSIPLAAKLDSENIPYVFLSGRVETLVTPGRSTPHTVLAKPFDPKNLVAHVERLLSA